MRDLEDSVDGSNPMRFFSKKMELKDIQTDRRVGEHHRFKLRRKKKQGDKRKVKKV